MPGETRDSGEAWEADPVKNHCFEEALPPHLQNGQMPGESHRSESTRMAKWSDSRERRERRERSQRSQRQRRSQRQKSACTKRGRPSADTSDSTTPGPRKPPRPNGPPTC